MLRKLATFLSCFMLCIFFMSTHANAEGTVISIDTYLNNLYSIPSTDNYNELKGFPNNDKFKIYYTGNYQSYSVHVEDIKDPTEKVIWYYNGIAHTNTRKECYSFFISTSYYRSIKGESEVLSEKWFENTFGQVYSDWFEYMAFTDEATTIVNKYLEKQSGKTNDSIYNYHSGNVYYPPDYNSDNDV